MLAQVKREQVMQRWSRYFLALGWCSLSLTTVVRAADGSFDSTFASGGRTTFNLTPQKLDDATAVGELADGGLLVSGICNSIPCLARLKPDGSFDTSYGQLRLGYEILDTTAGAPPHSTSRDMILLPDGRAVLTGCANSVTGAIFVVLADGSGLDTSVGNGQGYFAGTEGPGSTYNCPNRVRRQADGKFVVVQAVTDSSYGNLFVVSRVQADLSGLDPTFGSNGIARVAFGLAGASGNNDVPQALEIQSDGKIVVGGYGSASVRMGEFARLLSNGQLDTSFGGNGDGRLHYSAVAGSNTLVFDLALDAEQRIVFGGQDDDGTNYYQIVGRLTSAGVLDSSFDNGHLYTSAANTTGAERVSRVAITSTGVIALGFIPRTNGDSNQYFELTRFDETGHKVPTFGGGGSTYASFASVDDTSTPTAEVITSRGIVVVGASINTAGLQIGVARFQFDSVFANGFD
jgi:uncharacterized delta-60 repeat protein